MLNNGWIFPMHTVVPGYDGKTGVGGRCLPKDFLALSDWCRSEGLQIGHRAGAETATGAVVAETAGQAGDTE